MISGRGGDLSNAVTRSELHVCARGTNAVHVALANLQSNFCLLLDPLRFSVRRQLHI